MNSSALEEPTASAASGPAVAGTGTTPHRYLRSLLTAEMRSVVVLAAGIALLHVVLSGRYGYFRDELYYAACGERLAWGYVDLAPLVAVIARFARRLMGDSLLALRLLPALAGSAKILLTGWMVRELGGRGFAQTLAATTVFVAPVFLAFDTFLSPNAFEPVFWMLCAAILMRVVNGGSPKLWLAFGLVAGIGLLNKQSMLFYGLGLLVGLLFTPQREFLRERWPWLGVFLAFVIFLPHVAWQALHGWPTLEFLITVGRLDKSVATPLEFVVQQTLLFHPLAMPIWLAGLHFFLRRQEGKRYRALGWAYLAVLGEMLLLKGRNYYLAPAYPMLLAAGAVWIERWIQVRNAAWWKPASITLLAIGGVVTMPLAMPILPVEALARYASFWQVERVRVEDRERGKLPQLFAEMFGWEEQVATLARVYRRLSPEEQARAAILGANYGQAAAIDYFGPRYGLPKAISPHNGYYLWGPRDYTGEVVISVGLELDEVRPFFGRIEHAAMIAHEYAMPDENNLAVYILRDPKSPLQDAWPALKLYN